MTSKLSIEAILAESEREVTRYSWEGTFADYLRMAIRNPSLSRLSHALVYDAIMAKGTTISPDGGPIYGLFEGEIFGLERNLQAIVSYFAASAKRLEVRKRILLLLGPPASGKSTVVDLIKRALERYSRTDAGAVYTIRGCPMQEEPLHLVPEHVRGNLEAQYGLYVEGDLCPRCRHLLRSEYGGKAADMPIARVTLDEREAVGIGYYLATNPNPADASLLVGSVDESKMDGDRWEVAARAFRLDGELNIANRGLMEFVEMFKANRHMLNTLLDLAQGQMIKNQKFGSVYADEAIIGHSNEGDFDSFVSELTSEALRDRIIAVQVPYNLRVREEAKIYQKMMKNSKLEDVHMSPLALPVASTFATLTRLEPPDKQGMSLVDKLHLYDGQMVVPYSKQDVKELQRRHPAEGMRGISPRYVMNRIDVAATRPDIVCISPLATLDSLWQGLGENVSLNQQETLTRYVGIVAETVKEHGNLAIREIQRAFEDSFEESAGMLLESYLANVDAFTNGRVPSARPGDDAAGASERDMRDIERPIGVKEMKKAEFRQEVYQAVSAWKRRGWTFTYASEPRVKAAIESRLFPPKRKVERGLTQPRFAKQRVEWTQRRSAIKGRLESSYGYCSVCSEDLINYAAHVVRNKPVLKTPKGEGIEWLWPLYPDGLESPEGSG